MHADLPDADLKILLREAAFAARRLIRRLRLDWQDLADLSQDLLFDCLARLPAFDPARGTLGAFAGCVMAHHAKRIALRIRRERLLFGVNPVSLDEPVSGADRFDAVTTRGDMVAEADGYAALMGQPTDWTAILERRLDLERATTALDASARELCAGLADASPQDLADVGGGSRAGIYRRVGKLRLSLLSAGVAGG